MQWGSKRFMEKSEGLSRLLPPSPLFWELCVLSGAMGTLAVSWPLPSALAGLLIFAAFCHRLRHPLRAFLFILAFGAGWFAAAEALGDAPAELEWLTRKPVLLRGRVAEVQGHPDNTLRVYLEDAHCADAPERRFPGLFLWYARGDEPAVPGRTATVRLRAGPVRGFANAHVFDTERYWAMRGVWYRGYAAWGDTRGAVYSGAGHWWARLRRTLGERMRAALLSRTNAAMGTTGVAVPGSGSADGAKTSATEAGKGRVESCVATSPGKAVLPALIMNDRSLLRRRDMDLLGKASLTHSIALSGLHLGFMLALGMLSARLVCRIFPGVMSRVPRRMAGMLMGVPLAGLYLWLGGAPITLIRAAWMFAAFGIALALRRPAWLIDGAFAALLGLLCLDPLTLHQLGAQLSLIAVLTLAFCRPLTRVWTPRRPHDTAQARPREKSALPARDIHATSRKAEPNPRESPACAPKQWLAFRQKLLRGVFLYVSVSFLIQLAALPILAWNFGTVTPWFFLNALWLPVLGCFVFPLALVGVALAALNLIGAAEIVFTAAAWPADLLLFCLEALERRHWLVVWTVTRPHWLTILGFYAALAALAHAIAARRKQSLALAGAAALLCVSAFGARLDAENPGLARLTVFDVSHGQSLLVETPDNTRVLIDGGGRILGSDPGKFAVVPSLTFNRAPSLTAVINTHPDVDHLRGLAYVLENMEVGAAYFNEPLPDTEDGERIRDILARKGMKARLLRRGDALALSEDVTLEALYPRDADREIMGNRNNRSLALLLKDRHTGKGLALFSGDLEKRGLRRLLQDAPNMNAQILVLPHHGAASSMLPAFYDAVRPKAAIASCGFRNAWGFPAASVRKALAERGIKLLTTASGGRITVEWTARDRDPSIKTFRTPP